MIRKVFPQRVHSHRHNSTSDLPVRLLGDPIETGVNSSLVAGAFR
jgi:hypothetical protein